MEILPKMANPQQSSGWALLPVFNSTVRRGRCASTFSRAPHLCSKLLVLWLSIFSPALCQGQVSRKILDGARIEPRIGQPLPMSAKFQDHAGNTVHLREIVGKRPVVLCLVYFDCPMLCKVAADGLIRTVGSLPETVGQDFDIVLASFDPRDTPERADAARTQAMKKYARDESEAGWHFLTGSQASIDQLTQAVGFHYVWDEESQQFAHAAGLMIVSPEGIVTQYLDGVQFSPKELISAVNRAANNELSLSEPTSFVRCYLYDPTTGKFGSAVLWTIRVLGGLTVAALAIGIYRLQRRENLRSE